METAEYIRPSVKFGDEAVLIFATTSGILGKEATVEDLTDEIRRTYDGHMEKPISVKKTPMPKG
jgi:hypothetical protein